MSLDGTRISPFRFDYLLSVPVCPGCLSFFDLLPVILFRVSDQAPSPPFFSPLLVVLREILSFSTSPALV